MPSSKRELQGQTPRPSPLKVSNEYPFKAKKPAPPPDRRSSPAIVHVHSPRVIHARPQDFMKVVQLLTGKDSASYGPTQPAGVGAAFAQSEGARTNPSVHLGLEFRSY